MSEGRPIASLHLPVSVLVFAGVWAVLSGGALSSWIVGIPVVTLTTLASGWVGVPRRLPRLAGSFWFLILFIRESFRAGLGATRLALMRRVRIHPGWLHHRWRIDDPSARVLLANLTSLLPGTLSTRVTEEELVLHVLDLTPAVRSDLLTLEDRVASLFGVQVKPETKENHG